MGSSELILIDFAKQLLGQEKEMKRTMLSGKSQVRYSWELGGDAEGFILGG